MEGKTERTERQGYGKTDSRKQLERMIKRQNP